MLRIRVHNLGDVTIFRGAGRIVFGFADAPPAAASKQPDLRIAVLDMAEVTAIDAAGIGVLVSMRNWAAVNRVALKLMNLTPTVEDLLELTNLKSSFVICSVAEMLDLLCRAFRESQHIEAGVTIETPGKIFNEHEIVFA